MAQSKRNINELRRSFDSLRYKSDVFGVFLFDEGPSQRFVRNFARDWFTYLDDLARSADMFLFIPLGDDQDSEFKNFSFEVGRLFNIKPNQLPGILLFSRVESPLIIKTETGKYVNGDYTKSDKEGIYLPLETELFENDINKIEDILNDLFSIIHECRKKSTDQNELLESLRSEVESLKRKQELRPAVNYVKGAIFSVVSATGIILGEITRKTLVEKGMALFIPGN